MEGGGAVRLMFGHFLIQKGQINDIDVFTASKVKNVLFAQSKP